MRNATQAGRMSKLVLFWPGLEFFSASCLFFIMSAMFPISPQIFPCMQDIAEPNSHTIARFWPVGVGRSLLARPGFCLSQTLFPPALLVPFPHGNEKGTGGPAGQKQASPVRSRVGYGDFEAQTFENNALLALLHWIWSKTLLLPSTLETPGTLYRKIGTRAWLGSERSNLRGSLCNPDSDLCRGFLGSQLNAGKTTQGDAQKCAEMTDKSCACLKLVPRVFKNL